MAADKKYMGNTVSHSYKLLKIQVEEGRRGRKVLGSTKQVIVEESEIGKLA